MVLRRPISIHKTNQIRRFAPENELQVLRALQIAKDSLYSLPVLSGILEVLGHR